MFEFLKFWKKEEPDKTYPNHFLEIDFNDVAKSKGIRDDFNKEIRRVKNGERVETLDYSKSQLSSLKQVYEIPVFDHTNKEQEEEFDYDSFSEFGAINYKK
jgi:hypothetical protein